MVCDTVLAVSGRCGEIWSGDWEHAGLRCGEVRGEGARVQYELTFFDVAWGVIVRDVSHWDVFGVGWCIDVCGLGGGCNFMRACALHWRSVCVADLWYVHHFLGLVYCLGRQCVVVVKCCCASMGCWAVRRDAA